MELTIAQQACRIFDAAEQMWVEDGLWSVWEHPDQHPGAVTLQVCTGDPRTAAAETTRAYGGQLLTAAGWRVVAQPSLTADGGPYLVAYPPGLHNYCPHLLTLRCYDPTASEGARDVYQDVILPSVGNARVSQTPGECLDVVWLAEYTCHIPVYGPSRYGAVTGLPDPCPGHAYIVSMMVAQALPERADLLVPGTGPADYAIRENGNIVAVTRLVTPNGSALDIGG